jgi:hypothetical protein
MVVLLSALWIIRAGGKFLSNYIGVTFIVTSISMLFITYVLLYNPLKDYRPYAVGSDLKEKMNDGQEGVYESLLVYENSKTGEVKEFSSTSPEFTNSKIWEDKAWTYKSMVQKVIVETKLPSIADFEPSISISDIGEQEMELEYVQEKLSKIQLPYIKLNDKRNNSIIELPLVEFNTEDYKKEDYEVIDTILITDPNVTDIKIKEMVLNSSSICILLAKDINDANWNHIDEIKAIQKGCKEKGIPFIMICNAGRDVINSFKDKYNFELPVFVNDEITLKSISRSNPSLLIVQDAVVKGKFPNRSIPSMKSLNKTIFNK